MKLPRRRDVFIGTFIAVQLALPLSYYTVRADKNDERFAWRMFSDVRMMQCKPRFYLGDSNRPMRLSRSFHTAWINLAKRGRMAVIDAMAGHLCKQHPDTEVHVDVQCMDPHGKTTQVVAPQWDVCALGGVR